MNIAFFTDTYTPQINGVVTSIIESEHCLETLGHKTFIFAPRFEKGYIDDPHVYRFWAQKVPVAKEHRWGHANRSRLKKDIVLKKIDIIHYHTQFFSAYAARAMGRKLDLPLIQTYHTLWEEYFHHYVPFIHHRLTRLIARRESKRICSKIALVISPSQQIKDVLISYGVKTPITVLPTGINLAPFKHTEIFDVRERFQIAKDKHILLFAGRLAKEKNIDFVLKCMAALKKKRKDFVLFLAGGGDSMKSLKKMAADLNIERIVKFADYIPRNELISVYHAARLLLFPSHTETQGLVAVEAFACGTPVLALNSMGLKDVLKDQQGGFLLEDDLKNYVKHIEMMLDDEPLYAGKVLEARRRAEDFSSMATNRQLEKIYQNVIAEHKAAKRKIFPANPS